MLLTETSKMRKLYKIITQTLPSLWYCLISGLHYQKDWHIRGKIIIIKKNWFERMLLHLPNGTLNIGKNFKCNNKIKSNSIGLIQPCVFNIYTPNSSIVIGDNVGISGSTICATTKITIGDNVLIGSGCLITDTDAHPISWEERKKENYKKTLKAPISIGNDVFIGARSIILKGVNIGDRVVIGAGSVVSKDIPNDSIVAGNPARPIHHNMDSTNMT